MHAGAWLALRSLWPSVRLGWRRNALGAGSVVALSGWAVPALLGRGILGNVELVGAPLKVFSATWTVTALLVMLAGVAFAVSSRVVGRLAGGRRTAPADGAEGLAAGPEAVDLSRRSLLSGMGRALPVAAVATSVVGVVGGSGGFTVRRETVRVAGLPAALDGFKIGQITDLHVGAFIGAADVHRAVATMNDEGVHLQVMTGDLIDDLAQLDETFAALATCAAPHGMLAILGNHEHWRGLPPILEAYAQQARNGTRLRLLVDEAHVVEHGGARLRVVGVDYPMTMGLGEGRAGFMRRSADVAFRGVQADETVLCLSHHPDFFPLAAEKGAHLTLSGHTHGGQIAFLGIPVFGFVFKHMLGRYLRGARHLYVSGGTGHWLPFRIGVPTEVTILTLAAA